MVCGRSSGGGHEHLIIGAGACNWAAVAALRFALLVRLEVASFGAREMLFLTDGGGGALVAAFTAAEAIAIAEGIETEAAAVFLLEGGGGGGDGDDDADDALDPGISDGIDDEAGIVMVELRVSTTEGRPEDSFRWLEPGAGIEEGASTEAASVVEAITAVALNVGVEDAEEPLDEGNRRDSVLPERVMKHPESV